MTENSTLKKVIFGAIIDHLVSDKTVLTDENRSYLIHLAESDAFIEQDTPSRILVRFREFIVDGFDFSMVPHPLSLTSLKDVYIKEVQSYRDTKQILSEYADETYGWYIARRA